MPGDDKDDCPHWGVNGACAQLRGASDTDVILAETSPCAIGSGSDDGDGYFPVQCKGNSVLTGFGVSGSNANEVNPENGVSYHNVGYCADVQDGFVVDRSRPNFHAATGYGNTVTCDKGTVATAFCNGTGGNTNCENQDGSGGTSLGWIRCDTVREAGGPSCGSHGTLKNNACECDDGFTNSKTGYCDIPSPTYCKNGGTWDESKGRCSCGTYSGDQCQVAPSQSCGHGTWNGTACSCVDGFANGDSQCSVPPTGWCGKGEWKDGACACPSGSTGARCEPKKNHMLPIVICVVLVCIAAGLFFAYKKKP
jgi:hypothetical protein